jgi:minor extracellular serine protease Vpr
LRFKAVPAIALAILLLGSAAVIAAPSRTGDRPVTRHHEGAAPKGFIPAAGRATVPGRYFVIMKAPALVDRITRTSSSGGGVPLRAAAQREAVAAIQASQVGALSAARAAGGKVVFRYERLINGFSVQISRAGAEALARRPEVQTVQPVDIVKKALESSVPFIGATKVWRKLGVRGKGITVADVDTGIDYTHKAFGGPGTVEAYNSNDPTVIEPGTFPTDKVVGGYDFVGENYDVLDAGNNEDQTNDVPQPDPDPLDEDGHGTHTASTVAGFGVKADPANNVAAIGKGVAPKAKLLAVKVWDEGNSTADILVAGYEFAVDPNQDGSTSDKADVLTFSGGVDYGTKYAMEAVAARKVVQLGTVFVAAAGNDGNQPSGGSAYVAGTPGSEQSVITVGASIDQFKALTVSVDNPATQLPEFGTAVHQDWSGDLNSDMTGSLYDARELFPPAAADGSPAPSDREFCDPVSGTPVTGKIVLIYKGSTGSGDCNGADKVVNAQAAGADAVILWSGFAGAPFGLGPGDVNPTIPAVMVSTADGAALGDLVSPNAPDAWNTASVTVTLHADESVIPGYADRITDFTSEGPARVTNILKPDVTAPGSDITAAGVGTGTGSLTISGTSMATPHVSGVAALLKQIHPGFSPAQIKALIMNQATHNLTDNAGDAGVPVSATVIGAGRVRAYESATAKSYALPGSLSFGLKYLDRTQTFTRTFHVRNFDKKAHDYTTHAKGRYTDFAGDPADVSASPSAFTLQPGQTRKVTVRLTVDPAQISATEHEYGWYYFNTNIDGGVVVRQTRNGTDKMWVPWHVAPIAASNDRVAKSSLDLTNGSGTFAVTSSGAGTSHADSYLLGATDEAGLARQYGEADITHIGARSFTGGDPTDGVAQELPPGVDDLSGISWTTFLENSPLTEPIEFGVRTNKVHNTTETLEVDVLIDVGADGIFANPAIGADFLAVKVPGDGSTCLYDLSQPDPFSQCAADYFPDYSNYNSNVLGIVVDAQALGLTQATPDLSYQVKACTGVFSGDVPSQVCDEVGDVNVDTGTYVPYINVTDPALDIHPLVCGGFWKGPQCGQNNPVTVTLGSASQNEAPSILELFPNNKPEQTAKVIRTVRNPPSP